MTCEGYDVNGEDANGVGPGASGGGDPADGAAPADRTSPADGAADANGMTAPAEGTISADGTASADGTVPADGTAPADGTVPADGTAPADGTVPADGTAPADGAAEGVEPAANEEAVWQDLVARFDLPADLPEAVPWPDSEDLAPAAGAEAGDPGPARNTGPAGHGSAAGADRTRVIRPASPPRVPAPASELGTGADPGAQAESRTGDVGDNTEEHYIPPPPPPLPHLDSVAKGAWTAVFGGPAYLLLATLLGWVVPGWAALLAVAAFIGGFAVVVLRLGDGRSRGDGPDNGAVL
jgi:hypothetical protein